MGCVAERLRCMLGADWFDVNGEGGERQVNARERT